MRGLSWPKQKSSIGNLFLVSPKESIWYLVYLEKCCHTPFPLSPWNEEKSGVLQKHLFWNSHDCHWHRHSEWTFEPQSCVSNWLLTTIYNLRKWPYISYIISRSIRLPSSQSHLRCGKRSSWKPCPKIIQNPGQKDPTPHFKASKCEDIKS